MLPRASRHGHHQSALQTLVDTAMRSPGVPEGAPAGRAVVACSEGRHVLPGLMAAGVQVCAALMSPSSDLGARTRAGRSWGLDPPSAVAVTCAMPMSLSDRGEPSAPCGRWE